jgi:hypothetical protein
MPSIRCLSWACAAALLAAVPAHAQQLAPPDAGMVEQIAALARANLTRARLSDGSQVPPETPEELSRPIVPAALVPQTVGRGFLTAELEACALDWQGRSFVPYMQRLRASRRYSDRQMAYLGLLHGFSQGAASRALATRAPCTDGERRRLLRVAAETPILTP